MKYNLLPLSPPPNPPIQTPTHIIGDHFAGTLLCSAPRRTVERHCRYIAARRCIVARHLVVVHQVDRIPSELLGRWLCFHWLSYPFGS